MLPSFSSLRTYSPFALIGLAVLSVSLKGPVSGTTDPILEIHTDALTTYKYASATAGQDVQPRVGQRGMNLDGSLRAAPSQLMRIGGNPFENAWSAPRLNGMRLDLGTYAAQDVDIALPAEGFSWVIGRSYNARQADSGGSHRDSNGYQGKNWFQNSQPEIVFYNDGDDTKDVYYLHYGADRFAEYKRIDSGSATGKGTNGATGIAQFVAGGGGPDVIVIHDQHGNQLYFFGFNVHAGAAKGQIWKIVDPDNNIAYVGHATVPADAITNGYDPTYGYITEAYDSSGRRYDYTYTTLDSVQRLTKVEAKDGSTVVAKVEYEYYSTSESYGDVGDLKLVQITTPMTDSGVEVVRKKYYRYWEGTFNSSTNPGHVHALKYIVDFEGTRRQDWEDLTFDEDFLTLSDSSLESYASAYFEYDSDHRVNEAWFNGECGCSGGINGTHYFEYETNGSFSDNTSAYDTGWKTRTIVQQPDGTYLTQYWDEAHQPLSRAYTDADPDNTSPSPEQWVTEVTRNSDGAVTTIYTPANIDTYTHSTGAISNKGFTGLVWVYTRASSGSTKSFATAQRFKVGQNGASNYYAQEWEYGSEAVEIGGLGSGDHNIRPFMDDVHTYQVQDTSTSNRITMDYAPTVTASTLTLTTNAATEPSVATAKNGSGSSNALTPYLRADGTTGFSEDADGVLSYRGYTDGRMTSYIEDADTTQTSDFDSVPSGLTSDSDAVHRKTTYAYDDQGRLELETRPDGRAIKTYYSKLADGRVVTLRYNDYETSPSTKFYGPVQYTVRNHAGQVEAQGTVALTSNESSTALTGHVDETDDDPITAMDLGSLARLTTHHYNDSGAVLEETRLYFDIPASGAGTDGTNYDPTLFAYDDMGRRWRTEEASGTVRREVYDALGRVSARWLGTNDNSISFPGGDTSGTENMVKIEELEYDSGNDDGNSYLTKRTLFVEDSATDKRETTFTNDVRGRVLLEARPTAPHAFHKYDNEGRRLATGLFSSTASINTSSDDPTTETANRLALTEWEYDEMGRLWKTTHHEIDASDGSDDDTLLHELWRDEEGRIIKEDGPQLTKTEYDRLGRVKKRYILATVDDTAYAHADDVSGDLVLEESQSIYDDDSGELRLQVDIARHHDDYGGGETTGALDTNADSDDLLVTAANVKGRPQITAFWYDRFNRQTDMVRYGNNNKANFDRDGLSVPTRSDTKLRTSYSYGTDGQLQEVTDPRDLVKRTEYDDAGRMSKEVRNYDASVNSGAPSGTDDNQTIKYEYTDGLRTKITADLPSGSTDQDTTYTYGTTKGATAGDSKIATGHFLQEIKYPDSASASDVVSLAYNAQGEEIWREDQAGNIIEVDFDDSGRQEHRRVTNLASGFDGAVRRISLSYEELGRPELVTQYDNATVGSGSVVDEVKYTYDGWGGITKFEQDRNSAVGAGGSVDDYEVSYSYAKATTGRNTVRRSDMTLPSGNVITFSYASADEGSSISRVSGMLDGAVKVAEYDYLGLGHVVGTTFAEADISSLAYTTSGNYPDFDRFNRIVSNRWTSDTPSVDFYDVDIRYDRNSGITLIEDNVHIGFDVSYTLDDLDRLTDAQEGTWGGSSISSETRHQEWTLSHTGNWDLAKLDLDGDNAWGGTDEYNDDRTHNDVNELTGRDTDDNGTDDHTLTYDAVGNLTDDDENYEYEYDAFGRLRKINNQSSALVAEFTYNGLGFLIGTHEDLDDDGDVDGSDPWFYTAYDEAWRTLARFRSSDTDPKEEFLNQLAGLDGGGASSYINGVVLREKDANTAWTSASDGTLEERYYYCQNWRGDVSALVDSSTEIAEWAKYSSYGAPTGLPGADTDSDGDCDSTDIAQIQALIDTSQYDVRGDVDLDGDVDASDKSTAQGRLEGTTLGWEQLTALGSTKGFAGYSDQGIGGLVHVRNRTLLVEHGRWLERDPLGYIDGINLYEYISSQTIALIDPFGTQELHPSQRGTPPAHPRPRGTGGAGPDPPGPPGPSSPPRPWGPIAYHCWQVPPSQACECHAYHAYEGCLLDVEEEVADCMETNSLGWCWLNVRKPLEAICLSILAETLFEECGWS